MTNQRGLGDLDLSAFGSPDTDAASAAELLTVQAAKAAEAVLAAEAIVSKALAVATLAGLANHEASPAELRETAEETLRVAKSAATDALALAKMEARKVLALAKQLAREQFNQNRLVKNGQKLSPGNVGEIA